MTSMWDYHESMGRAELDVIGYDVEATDGGIGTVDEANGKAGSSYLVVDTGFWIFGRKRMIPAGVVQLVDDNQRKVFVTLTRDDIKSAPDFDDQDCNTREPYDSYYGPLRR